MRRSRLNLKLGGNHTTVLYAQGDWPESFFQNAIGDRILRDRLIPLLYPFFQLSDPPVAPIGALLSTAIGQHHFSRGQNSSSQR